MPDELITIGGTSPILDYAGRTRPAAAAISQVTTILNGLLNGDIAGAGYNIGSLGGLNVGYLTKREYWVGIRTSGKAGSGSKDDPFDVSTQSKFDAKMAALLAIPGAIVCLRENEIYQASGDTMFRLAPGVKIYGAGPTRTKISAMSQGTMFSGVAVGTATDIEIEGLTIDCRYADFAAATPADNVFTTGISIGSGRIQNVVINNPGGRNTTPGLEIFACIFHRQGSGSPALRCEFTDVIVQNVGPSVTAITAHNSDSANNTDATPTAEDVTFTRCYAYGQGDGIGFQSNGFKRTRLVDCVTTNNAYAFFRDTSPAGLIDIRGGFLEANLAVIALVQTVEKLVVQDVSLSLTTESPAYIRVDSVARASIHDNDFITPRTYWPPVINAAVGAAIDVYNNRFHNGVVMVAGGSPNQRRWNNRHNDGSKLINFEDNFFPYNGPLADALTERADNNGGTVQVITNGASDDFDVSSLLRNNGLINVTTNRVVAPAAGIMRIKVQILLTSVTSTGYVDIILFVGTQSNAITRQQNPVVGQTIECSMEVPCNAGDTFKAKITNATGASLTLSNDSLSTVLSAAFDPTALTP